MTKAIDRRMSAEIEGEFVVFLVGGRETAGARMRAAEDKKTAVLRPGARPSSA